MYWTLDIHCKAFIRLLILAAFHKTITALRESRLALEASNEEDMAYYLKRNSLISRGGYEVDGVGYESDGSLLKNKK